MLSNESGSEWTICTFESMSSRVWMSFALVCSLGLGEGRSDCGDCDQGGGVGGLCAAAEGCKQSSELWGWAWDTCGTVAVGGEQQNHQPLPGLILFRAVQDGMTVCKKYLLHALGHRDVLTQMSALGLGTNCVPRMAGFLSLSSGSCIVAARKGLLLGFPEDGCLIHRWLFTKLLSWCILNQCPSPPSPESYICLKLFV